MSDELENGLLEMQHLIHNQIKQIQGFKNECGNQSKYDDEFIKKNFMRIFDILADFYMNMESMYINNEGATRQIEAVKDAIFSLREVRENIVLQDKFNNMFAKHVEDMKENQKSFMKTYGVEEV
jgi:hypothetical protein